MSTNALIIVDLQNDFCPGGALAVPGGDRVVPVVNRLQPRNSRRTNPRQSTEAGIIEAPLDGGSLDLLALDHATSRIYLLEGMGSGQFAAPAVE